MSLPSFVLHVPRRVDDALGLLRDAGSRGIAMAGGTDVMVSMKRGTLAPEVVVHVGGIPELRGIRRENGTVVIGGGTTLAALASSDLLARDARGIVDAAARMGTVQVRTVGTAAGNLASAAACGDLAPVLVALNANLRLRSTSIRERMVPVQLFFTGARRTALHPGELITAVELPAAEPHTGSAYVKYGYRGGAQVTVVSAAVRIVRDGDRVRSVRLILGAVGPAPVLVQGAVFLIGKRMEGSALFGACVSAAVECIPISDVRGSEAYRRAMAAVVARRALELAWVRSAA